MSLTGNTVLTLTVLSFSNRSSIIPNAGSAGPEVNRAVTSYEWKHSSGSNVTLLACSTKSWVLWMWCGDLPTSGLSIFCKYLCHLIHNRSSAGHYRPEGGVQLVDLGEATEIDGIATCGVHGFISV